MKPLLIKGGRIIDPGRGMDKTGSLLIREGKISWMGAADEQPPQGGYSVLPASGLVVSPGFIDLHCHLRQPGYEHKETIASGAKAAAKGGFTTICAMPNTKPPLDNRFTLNHVNSLADPCPIRVLFIGCISQARKGKQLANIDEIMECGVVGLSDDGDTVMDAEIMCRALEEGRNLSIPIIDHCEDTSISEDGVMNEGKTAKELGLKGIPMAAEEIIVSRDLQLAMLTSAHVHIAHVSTEGSVNLIREAKEKGIKVTAEVTPHHLTLTEERVKGMNTSAKVNPPLRTKADNLALAKGLSAGVIDAIATDHAPHAKKEKQTDFQTAPFGISGFETALGSLMGLVHSKRLDMVTVIARLTTGPAKIINRDDLGTLAVGAPADITVFDPEREWTVNTEEFLSKGKNTPLAGETLKGRVMATIAEGEMAYKDESLQLKEG